MIQSGLFARLNRPDVKTRFAVSFLGNICRVGIMFLISLFLARRLGPAAYGDYNFLLTSFLGLRTLVDLGTGSAFLTFCSEKRRGRNFFLYYLSLLLLQFSALLLLVLLLPDWLRSKLWVSHPTQLILWALLASFVMNQIWEAATNLGESVRDSFSIQVRNILLSFVFFLSLLALDLSGTLEVKSIYYAVFACYGFLAIAYVSWIFKKAYNPEEVSSFSEIHKAFVQYSSPLAFTYLVTFTYTFSENWLLQKYGGSIEQGYYSIGWKFSTIGLLATTALLKIFWKEIAEAKEQGNLERVRTIYYRTCKILYSSSALLCCFLCIFSGEILGIFLGNQYKGAEFAFALLLLYPVHQSLGQIVGAYLQATAQTRVYRNVSIFVLIFSLPVSYFVLAKTDLAVPGLDLGSKGLAMKMLFTNIVSVNLFSWIIYKESKVRLKIREQLIFLIGFLAIAVTSKTLCSFLLADSSMKPLFQSVTLLGLSAFMYFPLCVLIINKWPELFGLNASELEKLKNAIRKKLKGNRNES